MQSTTLVTLRNILLVLTGITVAGYLTYTTTRNAGIEALRSEAEKRLRAISTALFAPADKYSYLPEVVSSHPVMINALLDRQNPHAAQEANLYLEHLNAGAGTADIYLTDTTGLTIASSNWAQKLTYIGRNYAFRPYFQDAIKTGSGKFYAMGIVSLKPGYYITHVVRHGGTTLGVAVVKVDMSTLDQAWDTDDVVVTVTDSNGVAFLSSLKGWKYRPTWPLAPEAQQKLAQTRQYDGVLKEPLAAALVERFTPNELLVKVRTDRNGHAQDYAPYLMRSGKLDGVDWNVNIFMPMEQVNVSAARLAVLAAGALSLAVLALLYVAQTRSRIEEREKSQFDLEQAHGALEQKHRELETLSEDLRIVSITDPLTGAFNRRYFLESVTRMASLAERHDHPLSILMLDVDHFKRINDQYGHPIGDKVLQALTTICIETLREGDVFARFGGEEFIVALPNTDEEAARMVAERLRARVIAHPVEVDGRRVEITLSGGIARYRIGENSIEDTIRRADEALYQAKSDGRNRVIVQ